MAFLLAVGKNPAFETAQHLGKKRSPSWFGFQNEVQLRISTKSFMQGCIPERFMALETQETAEGWIAGRLKKV